MNRIDDGACVEGLELAVGTLTLIWELDLEMWDELLTKLCVENPWREAHCFGVKTEDTNVKSPVPVEGDIGLTDKLIRRFPGGKRVLFQTCPVVQRMFTSDELI